MSAAATALPIWLQELPSPAYEWAKVPPALFSHLFFRTTPTAFWLIGYLTVRAHEKDPKKSPGESEVLVSMLELLRASRMSKRNLQYAIDEISCPEAGEDPMFDKHGRCRKGKSFVQMRRDPQKRGYWWCKILPKNWQQPSGLPGGPTPIKPRKPRKSKALTANLSAPVRRAALECAQPVSQGPCSDAQPVSLQAAQSVSRSSDGFEPVSGRNGEATKTVSRSAEGTQHVSLVNTGTNGESTKLVSRPEKAFSHAGDEAFRNEFRDRAQPVAGYQAIGFDGLFNTRETSTPEELASVSKLDSDEDVRQLREQIEGLQRTGVCRDLGEISDRTAANLLRAARQSLPGPVEISAFFARTWKFGGWKSWGGAVVAVREDLGRWLVRSGWPTKEGPIWNSPVSELPAPVNTQSLEPEPEGNPWSRVKNRLKSTLSPTAFQNWIERTRFAHLDSGARTMVVFAPDQVSIDFIREDFSEQISSAIAELGLDIAAVEYRLPG